MKKRGPDGRVQSVELTQSILQGAQTVKKGNALGGQRGHGAGRHGGSAAEAGRLPGVYTPWQTARRKETTVIFLLSACRHLFEELYLFLTEHLGQFFCLHIVHHLQLLRGDALHRRDRLFDGERERYREWAERG